MSSLHIGTITFDWYPFEPRALRLAQAAADAGHHVDVICPRRAHEPRRDSHGGVQIYRVPMRRPYGCSFVPMLVSWWWFLILAGVTISKLHLARRYDIILVHNMPDFLVFAALLPKLLGAKVVLDVQDASPELMAEKARGVLQHVVIALATWQERASTAFADHVITIGWTVEELLLQRGVPKEKVTSILNSADSTIFPHPSQYIGRHGLPQKSRDFVLMYHGTVSERQGLDIAIRAVARAKRVVPRLRLEIKGAGDHIPFLQELARELGISEAVVFSTMCPVDQVADFIMSGDVGIIPYHAGGYMEIVLPTKAFEFAWMQRPMIASELHGIRSLFRPESILFCDPSDPNSFADAIIDLYLHPEKCARLARNAEEDYRSYRWERMAAHYQALLTGMSQTAKKVAVPSDAQKSSPIVPSHANQWTEFWEVDKTPLH